MAITLITSPPPALTPPELQEISQRTPESFEGIAPLLRHFESLVDIRIEPPFEGFSQSNGGSLYATEEALSFYSNEEQRGISFPYPHITLHAISRNSPSTTTTTTTNGTTNGANGSANEVERCLYCQLEESETIDETDEGLETREMWITPRGQGSDLDKLFSTVSYCASLHPPTFSSSTEIPSILSESQQNQQQQNSSSQASLFASMGLDPDSMVYADENGQLAGPGVAMFGNDGEEAVVAEGQFDEAVEGEQEESSAGRQRSDFVNPGRRAPY